jgi:hypothetical protein
MTRTSIVITLVALLALGTASGCKGDTVIKPDPQTKADLDQCVKDKAEKDKLIRAIEDESARLIRDKGSAASLVITIEGNALTVKPGSGTSGPPIDAKAAQEGTKEFLNVVAKSRGAIQKCYEKALKNNSGLQAKTVTLSVEAIFGATGQFKSSTFSPSLGDAFDTCIRTVASKWALPTAPVTTTFKAQVSLTPS